MVDALTKEFDPERLLRQQKFLVDRATFHAGNEGDRQTWHRACAATLRRDAAAIALLRGDRIAAATLFAEAGDSFAELGMFVGFSLLEFSQAGGSAEWRQNRSTIDERIFRAMNPEGGGLDVESREQPFLRDSVNSPRQLVYLSQALTVGHGIEPNPLRSRVQTFLLPVAEVPLGPTGIPLGSYMKLVEEVASMNPNVPTLSRAVQETWLSAVLRRQEQLQTARTDSWHWNLLPNPADLIDFDLMAVALIGVDRAGTTAPFDQPLADRDATVSLPLRAAKLLRFGLSE